MSESAAVVQFVELIRQAVAGSGDPRQTVDVMAWLGEREQVARGSMPAALMDNECPECGQVAAHLVQSLGNWDQYVCLACGHRHSYQLTKGGRK